MRLFIKITNEIDLIPIIKKGEQSQNRDNILASIKILLFNLCIVYKKRRK